MEFETILFFHQMKRTHSNTDLEIFDQFEYLFNIPIKNNDVRKTEDPGQRSVTVFCKYLDGLRWNEAHELQQNVRRMEYKNQRSF